MKIALCGNPNVGKTTLFNRLTRSDEPVGNWHGVTVDVRTKRVSKDVYLSDLPGAYSLSARTAEEEITRNELLFGDIDVAVCVAEVNNLRRNLYLLMQLAECGKRVALVVNMMDEARGKVDLDLLSRRLGIPVVGTSSKRENPKAAILKAASEAERMRPDYMGDGQVTALARRLDASAKAHGLVSEFVALKVLERDEYIIKLIGYGDTCGGSCSACSAYGGCDGRDFPSALRYGYIDKALIGVMSATDVPKRTLKIDRILLGKLALPIFLAVMAAVFVLTFEAGKPLSDLLVGALDKLSESVASADMPDWASSLISDGVIGGVGAVLAFLPQVVILFLLTALLQDSGYMSRVAFLTDDFFKRFGLSGRAAFSVVLGLGCSATAVLTTRGISGDAERRRAAFATPFCPCSARLTVFTALSAYFGFSGFVVAAMYVLGFAAALAVLKVMTLLRPGKSENAALIMEMPPYRIPQAKRVLGVVASNVLSFAARVGSVVLGVSVIMWVLCNFSVANGFIGGGEQSIMCTFASLIAPLFSPLGFGSWEAVTALLSGVAAKETLISVITALGGPSAVFTSRYAAVSFMIFSCLYVPCVATLSALAKENGIKSAVLSVAVHTAVAYVCSLVYYRSALLYAADKKIFYIVIAVSVVATAAVIAVVKLLRSKKKRAA